MGVRSAAAVPVASVPDWASKAAIGTSKRVSMRPSSSHRNGGPFDFEGCPSYETDPDPQSRQSCRGNCLVDLKGCDVFCRNCDKGEENWIYGPLHRVSSPMSMGSSADRGEPSHANPETVHHLDPVPHLLRNLQLFGAFTDVAPAHSGRRRWLAAQHTASPLSSVQDGRLGHSWHGVWTSPLHVLGVPQRILGGAAEAMIGDQLVSTPTARNMTSLRSVRGAV
jgi:hypothetical protein